MARWRLTEPHYLKVEGTKWEYTEVDRITGRPKRTQFSVPLLLNPNDENDVIAYGQGAEGIIVSNGNQSMPKDVIFQGNPTPGMLPLDEEAKAISESFSKSWATPTEEQPSYTEGLLNTLIRQIAEAQTGAQSNTKVEGMAELMAAMTAMMKQNQAIMEKLVDQRVADRDLKRKVA